MGWIEVLNLKIKNMESKHELTYLKGITNYRGTLVTKLIGKGYSIWGLYCETPADVDEAIDNAGKALERSIVYPITVKGGFNCQQTDGSGENSSDLGTDGTHVWGR